MLLVLVNIHNVQGGLLGRKGLGNASFKEKERKIKIIEFANPFEFQLGNTTGSPWMQYLEYRPKHLISLLFPLKAKKSIKNSEFCSNHIRQRTSNTVYLYRGLWLFFVPKPGKDITERSYTWSEIINIPDKLRKDVLHNPSVWTVEKELLCVCHIIIFVVEITLYGQFQADIVGISSMVCIIQVKALT